MSPEDKIYLPADLQQRLRELPRPLVMTNGVFDVLHRGHVDYLHRAAQLGASLLVAVNTDASARMLGKGPDRPLNKDLDRAYVLAGLSSVSMVTFFDTRTPLELIETIRPDIYVKGGDYDMETLEETRVVRRWGGQSVAIPFVAGFSTSSLVQRIRQPTATGMRKAAFLDRDGVINKDKFYVCSWEDFEFASGAIEGMQLLQSLGYQLVVVTNQSGLARGYYTDEQYQSLTRQMLNILNDNGISIAGVYHCPHHPNGIVPGLSVKCSCRKPEPGLILKAVRDLSISLTESLLIGDKPSDIKAARSAGVARAYSISSENKDSKFQDGESDGNFKNLLDCSRFLVQKSKIM